MEFIGMENFFPRLYFHQITCYSKHIMPNAKHRYEIGDILVGKKNRGAKIELMETHKNGFTAKPLTDYVDLDSFVINLNSLEKYWVPCFKQTNFKTIKAYLGITDEV